MPSSSGKPHESTSTIDDTTTTAITRSDSFAGCTRWGKNPEKAEGYADSTLSNTSYKVDQFNVWNWKETGTYGTKLTVDRADAYMMYLVMEGDTYSATHKDIVQKCLKRVFKYQNHVEGDDIEWEPEQTFPQDLSAPRDFLTMEKRRIVRGAALDYGTVPSYKSVTLEERDNWKTYRSQRFEKPKTEVTPGDWEKANSWKISSRTRVSLETGLRSIDTEGSLRPPDLYCISRSLKGAF